VTSPPWSRDAAGSDWAPREEDLVTNGRSGLTRPGPRGGNSGGSS
jgi:hypothetical protein